MAPSAASAPAAATTALLGLFGLLLPGPALAGVPEAFVSQLRCPFAKVWLEHGPERAAELLGVDAGRPHGGGGGGRRLAAEVVHGTCTYTNPFSQQETCMELHGASWTDNTAGSRCQAVMANVQGTLAKGARCETSATTAGWCSTAEGAEMTHTPLGSGSCEDAASGCRQWSQGTFVPDGACAAGGGETVYGTCTYTNPFSQQETCMEFHGDSWTDSSAGTRCGQALPNVAGTLAKGVRCATSATTAGWCSTAEGAEMTHTALGSGTCDEAASGCAQWSQGTFRRAGACGQTGGDGGDNTTGGAGDGRCAIAPGPIGAAHQLAQSPGYGSDCEGTPAQGSPYMWPARWTALVEAKSMAFGSDAVQYESRGRVWYMLDKNWKRMDTWFQKGVQRGVGQAPCESGNAESDLACRRDGPVNSTMLHRNNKMVFIDWAADGTISNCTWLDMGVIGNIRPDWFMDNRGASTAVQYLGDSHVYYMGEPRLVKQWRKKDFANQYFTMSMQVHPDRPNGTRWPLILNVPGEGFGDDFLQHWHGHRHVDASEESEFLLDETLVANGGSCPKSGNAGGGPPTGDQEHVPSNLEVDEAAWREIVHTESPIWIPPRQEDSRGAAPGSVDVGQGVTAESCFDAASSAARVTVRFATEAAVWAGISFRETSECLMTPRGGGNASVVYAEPDAAGEYAVSFGTMTPSLKHFVPNTLGEFVQGLRSEAEGFDATMVEHANGQLTLGFSRLYAQKPAVLHLSMAYGSDSTFGYHASRECFELRDLPPCPAFACPSAGGAGDGDLSGLGGNDGEHPVSGGRRVVATGGAAAAALALSAFLP